MNFKEKIEEDSKGILLIVEERDIFKNSVLKYFYFSIITNESAFSLCIAALSGKKYLISFG